MDCSTPGFPVHHQLPELTQTHVHRVSDAIQPSHPLLSLSPAFIRVFSSELVLYIRWSKYWSFSFSISPSNEYSGLIFFRIDWLDLLAVQGTLKSLLQHHSSKALMLRCSAFFTVQLSHPYMTTGRLGHSWSRISDSEMNLREQFTYDWPRQHMKKQRHCFTNKGPPNQRYGFSSSHIWMWELDYTKNWCFWYAMFDKTPESHLDCKEIQAVHPKGNHSWIVIGRADAEAQTPTFWPPDGKNWCIWKDPDAGPDWRQEEKGMTEDEMFGWHHHLNGYDFG